ncbi:30S ribosomal protein S4e [Candidatus Micrarchaeota archaeon]|nr:30S ribosomal protein S4e [Candidatus Micrarchaeota archaeon]
MANKSNKKHLKRGASSVFHGLVRKGSKWLKKPSPGKHALKESISLGSLLTEKLGLAENKKQAKILANHDNILIDGAIVKDLKQPVGLMDVLSIPKLGKNYRVTANKGTIKLVEITAAEAKTKYCKITGKKIIKKGKIQLNLHDSRNYLIEKEEDKFKVGDTLILSIPKQELKGVLKLEKNANCFIYRGRHSGETGKLEEIQEKAGSKESDAKIKTKDGEIITLKSYLFVIDDKFK